MSGINWESLNSIGPKSNVGKVIALLIFLLIGLLTDGFLSYLMLFFLIYIVVEFFKTSSVYIKIGILCLGVILEGSQPSSENITIVGKIGFILLISGGIFFMDWLTRRFRKKKSINIK
jgi:hypothetical protein